MDLFLYGHNYKYAAEQMLLSLFPDERPTYPPGRPGDNSASVTLNKGSRYATASCRLIRGGRTACAQARYALKPDRSQRDEVRLEQRIVKLAFYRAALAWGLEKPVWGSLTGVRPAKFLAGLVERDGRWHGAGRSALR